MAQRADPQDYFREYAVGVPVPPQQNSYPPAPQQPDHTPLIILGLVLGVAFLALLAYLAFRRK